MGAALSLQTYQGTAIGATLAALAASTGDSLAVANFEVSKAAWLLQIWADVQVAGTLRVRSPKFHDNVNGIRIDTIISDVSPLLPWGFPQRLYPADVLIVELAGSAVGGDIEYVSLFEYFEDLPGVSGRFLSPEEVLRRQDHLLTVENTIATGTGGGYTGSEAINAEVDQFITGTDYAYLGYKVDTECQAIGVRAIDFGNQRLGGPGIETDPRVTCDWFVRLSRQYGRSLIPIFNGQNKASVLVDAVQDENGADTTITHYLAKLRP
jgi:hypothetical protein